MDRATCVASAASVVASVVASAAAYWAYRCAAIGVSSTESLARLEARLTQPGAPALVCGPKKLTCSRECNTDLFDNFLCVKKYDRNVDFLDHMRAGDWCYDGRIAVVDDRMTVREVLDDMQSGRSTFALLLSSEDGSLLGVLDTPDVVRYILKSSAGISQSARRLLRQCVVARPSVSVGEICRHLCAGVRYIAVSAPDGTHQVVSQRAMIRMIIDSAEYDASALAARVGDCVDERPVIHCLDTDAARHAFELMAAYGVTSLPIVDPNGKATGVISATDVLVARTDPALLDANVLRYLERSRCDLRNRRPAHSIVSCTPEDDLMVALRIMMHEEVHHIYVLEDDVPTGVLSFVDILRRMVADNARDLSRLAVPDHF